MVRGSNPGGDEIFRTRRDLPLGPPCFLYNGYQLSFLGVKRPVRIVNHPLPSSAEVKESVELYLYIPSGPSWQVIWLNLFFFTFYVACYDLDIFNLNLALFSIVLQCKNVAFL
jgi:hypothetical protein